MVHGFFGDLFTPRLPGRIFLQELCRWDTGQEVLLPHARIRRPNISISYGISSYLVCYCRNCLIEYLYHNERDEIKS